MAAPGRRSDLHRHRRRSLPVDRLPQAVGSTKRIDRQGGVRCPRDRGVQQEARASGAPAARSVPPARGWNERRDGARAVDLFVSIEAPPEGVIDRVLVGTTRSGPWSRYRNALGTRCDGAAQGAVDALPFPVSAQRQERGARMEAGVAQGHRQGVQAVRQHDRHLCPLRLTAAKGGVAGVLSIDGRVAKKMDVLLR